jgi:hypothetical protein
MRSMNNRPGEVLSVGRFRTTLGISAVTALGVLVMQAGD